MIMPEKQAFDTILQALHAMYTASNNTFDIIAEK